MKKILFAVDGTSSCQKAAQFVVNFFGDREDCAISIIHVKTPIMLYGEAALAAYEEIEKKENAESDKLLEDFSAIFTNKGVNVSQKLLEGEAVTEVLNYAKDFDLLVIGQSEENFWNKIFSSNQNDFSEKSPIPILIVK
ncbi:universal stress protein [Helicobacter turcicus]|uniref:Universal stress protein n=1 Tax=Helicobacter turcicus TaxID=2867412 RepID=A0ABS7JM75_9HELI|nr:universal stress protein [Helicobacter turcicus]MBX7490478.1 universal stress protein [Helicobacter turcicus]MBX7545338.1 universal stress protein [Helicobacter turcicus]